MKLMKNEAKKCNAYRMLNLMPLSANRSMSSKGVKQDEKFEAFSQTDYNNKKSVTNERSKMISKFDESANTEEKEKIQK